MAETSFIKEYPDAMPADSCDALVQFFDRKVSSGALFINKGNEANGGGTNRSDEAIFLNMVDGDVAARVNEVVEKCWMQYVDEFKFLENYGVVSYAQKMQKTPPMGGFHTWHWEHAGDNINRNRMAVWTLYLTTHEDEGETEFLAHGLKVKPEKGKFCIFPADYTAVHRGNPVYSKDKYIVTGWYEYAPM